MFALAERVSRNAGSYSSDAAFVAGVRRFLSAALTPDLRAAGRDTVCTHSEIAACRIWHRRLYEQGWIAPAWPAAWGGTGWSAQRRLLFERECAANDAPVLFAGGIRNVGPLLIALGTPSQRERYLTAILDGRDLWCQGFSEPGAGSDLAALRTRAERRGDHYIVSGAKIWTTGADIANRMFCLVRTATLGRPQDGITFLLLDMNTPGLTVRPIRTIAGDHEFSEVLFDDVRVPVENRVGAENEGWSVAKQLMRFARASNTTTGLLWRALRRAKQLASDAADDDCARRALCDLECRIVAFESLELAMLRRAAGEAIGDSEASILKTLATELHQDIATALLDAAGPAAASTSEDQSQSPGDGAWAARKYLATRAASIYSGTNETHRNVIARQLLAGLGGRR